MMAELMVVRRRRQPSQKLCRHGNVLWGLSITSRHMGQVCSHCTTSSCSLCSSSSWYSQHPARHTLHRGTGPYTTHWDRSIHYTMGWVKSTPRDRSIHYTMEEVHTLHHGTAPYTTQWDRSIHYTMEQVHRLHNGTGPYIHYMMGQVHILHNHNETGPYIA